MTARLVTLTKDHPEAWALMPQALARARSFCEHYDTDTDPETLCANVRQHFIADGTIRVIVAVREGNVTGHCVVSIEEWCGLRHVCVVQYELDEALTREQVRDCLEQIAWWGKGLGAKEVRILSRIDERGVARAKTFQRHGFRPMRLLMRKEV